MRFDLGDPIGETGGFGKVYKCTDENGQVFACKVLENNTDIGIKRFEREVRLLSRLNHPNVMKVITYNITDQQKFYIMPLYTCSLAQVIPQIAVNTYAQFHVISAILSGIGYLHSEGVIHRDLKPENILYNNENDVVITDLGLGIQNDSNSTTLTRGLNFGTMRYCSPEQWRDMHSVDCRADIYALGIIIEDIMSNYGKIPIENQIIKYVIDKCTQKEKDARFTRIDEIAHFIDAYFASLFGWEQNTSLDELLLKLSRNQVTQLEVIDIANQVVKRSDKEKIEVFFSNISVHNYKFLETDSLTLARNLVKELCRYWNEGLWPFSYIDNIADRGEKIYSMSQDAEIKALIIYTVMDLAIYYNRWYAMGTVRRMFYDSSSNISVQSELAMRLRNNRLDIYKIFESENELPQMIRELYRKN